MFALWFAKNSFISHFLLLASNCCHVMCLFLRFYVYTKILWRRQFYRNHWISTYSMALLFLCIFLVHILVLLLFAFLSDSQRFFSSSNVYSLLSYRFKYGGDVLFSFHSSKSERFSVYSNPFFLLHKLQNCSLLVDFFVCVSLVSLCFPLRFYRNIKKLVGFKFVVFLLVLN